MWLLNYGLRIQCFRVTPYVMGDEVLLNFEQMIPVPDTEAFMVGMATKSRGELDTKVKLEARHKVRLAFWQHVIEAVNERSKLYENVSPKKDSWVSAGSGVGNAGFNMSATRTYCQAELYIGRSSASENQFIFDRLLARREELERAFGESLTWEPLEDSKACRIKSAMAADIYDEEMWPEMVSFLADRVVRLDHAFRRPLAEIAAEMRRA